MHHRVNSPASTEAGRLRKLSSVEAIVLGQTTYWKFADF
jgi:hypothetical protein